MINAKIFGDIKKYIIAEKEYNFLESGFLFLYPIDLDFTLDYEDIYYFPKDTNGIPMKEYKSVGITYNPTRVAAYGLSHWNRYKLERSNNSLEEFRKAASWFIENQSDGKWYYKFNWNDLKAPWISCMSQGEAISILTRAYILTNDPAYIEASVQAFESFEKTIEENGVLSRLDTGDIFFEEYPTKNPDHVLNGFMYSMIGLIELKKSINQDHLKYIKLESTLSKALSSLEKNVERWDTGYWSTYDLYNEKEKSRNVCTISYHNLQCSQMKYIATELGSEKLLSVSQKWTSYMKSPINRIRALIDKVYFRYRNPVQR